MNPTDIYIGKRVWWNDPDAEDCSGAGTVTAMQHYPAEADSVISLTMDDEGYVEAFADELEDWFQS